MPIKQSSKEDMRQGYDGFTQELLYALGSSDLEHTGNIEPGKWSDTHRYRIDHEGEVSHVDVVVPHDFNRTKVIHKEPYPPFWDMRKAYWRIPNTKLGMNMD